MGISLAQYRAAIGLWASRGFKYRSPSVSNEQDEKDQGSPPDPGDEFRLRGSWKLHITLLSFLIMLILAPSVMTINRSFTSVMNTDSVQYPFSPPCHEKLLHIGGVERHPGPPPSHEHILAELCAKAPDTDVRDCLRLYNPKSTPGKQCKELNKCLQPVLIATSQYLNMQDQTPYTKPTVHVWTISYGG